jgi:hypothetical protein
LAVVVYILRRRRQTDDSMETVSQRLVLKGDAYSAAFVLGIHPVDIRYDDTIRFVLGIRVFGYGPLGMIVKAEVPGIVQTKRP